MPRARKAPEAVLEAVVREEEPIVAPPVDEPAPEPIATPHPEPEAAPSLEPDPVVAEPISDPEPEPAEAAITRGGWVVIPDKGWVPAGES